MPEQNAFIYIDPQAIVPSPTEIKAFMFADYLSTDIDQEGRWYLNGTEVENFNGRGWAGFYIFDDEEGRRAVKVTAYRDRFLAPAVYFIAKITGGEIFYGEGEPSKRTPEDLIPLFGEDFDLAAALARIETMRRKLPAFFEKHFPFLAEYITAPLTSIYIREWRSIEGRSTHPKLDISNWVGKGYDKCTAYAFDTEIPEGFFACLSIGYSSQEWINVLWKRDGRKFWFSARNLSAYNEDSTANKVAAQLKAALQTWEEEDGDVIILDGDRMRPKIEHLNQ